MEPEVRRYTIHLKDPQTPLYSILPLYDQYTCAVVNPGVLQIEIADDIAYRLHDDPNVLEYHQER